MAKGTESLNVRDNYVMFGSERGLELGQAIRGLPVVNGVVSISYNADTKHVSSIAAHFIPDRALPSKPTLTAEEAQQIVSRAVQATKGLKAHFSQTSHLAYFAEFADPSPPHLVWVIRATTADSSDMFYVDAITGLIVSRAPMRMRFSRKVYDMSNSVLADFPQGLPPNLNATQIAAYSFRSTPHAYVQTANDILRIKIPYSIPEFPSTAHIVVRYGLQPNNSEYEFVDGKDYIRLNGALAGSHKHGGLVDDLVVHEFAHAVGTRTFPFAGDPSFEYAAMHESYGDAAASVVDVAKFGGPDDSTWIFGEEFFTNGDAIRSMRDPFLTTDWTIVADFMFDWYPNYLFGEDWTHENSGIVSHAYYLLVNGGQHARWAEPEIPNTIITALGEPTTRDIFFNAFRNSSLNSNPSFSKLKGAAMAHALAAHGSSARTQVKNAFEAVGICKTASVAPPAPTLQTIGDLLCAGRFNPVWDLITGATRYYGEVAPANIGFALSTPVFGSPENGTQNSCLFQVSQPSLFRMRACNDCGCGPW
ncbi:MAG: M4 family metallopeptidase, partial [Candidatus Binatia bacterium]